MDTKKAIELLEKDELLDEAIIKSYVALLKRGEIDRKIIEKMKNEKYDVWISLPGSFINLPDFVRDVEKEVIK